MHLITAILFVVGMTLAWGRPQFQVDPNARTIKMEETAVSSTTSITSTEVTSTTTSTTTEEPMLLLDPGLEEAVGGNFLLEGPVLHIWGMGAGVVLLTFLVLASMAGCALQARCRCPFKNRGKKEERREKSLLRMRMRSARIRAAATAMPEQRRQPSPLLPLPPAPAPSFVSAVGSVSTIKKRPPLAKQESDMSLPPTPTEIE